ncbi:PQ-loop repeat-containing protein [Mycoplasma tauri]|uniref:PQ-loop repeat-containing protein n=1 Tax=Mycoplasma tauri TaxID=547987 RepID=UPI001CBA74C8|nr:PQ-loop repeat-containing protein [Mycoplasma tauri]MBZ4204536.1 PQ-loop repeat-containing protein [Mycoplasma tauri]
MTLEQIFGIYTLDANYPISGWIAWTFATISIILTVIVGLPQLIYLLKNKDTGEGVNFYSFWIVFTGSIGWMLIGSWDVAPVKMAASAIANMLSLCLFIFTIYFTYRYARNEQKRKKAWIAALVSSLIVVAASALAIYGLVGKNSKGEALKMWPQLHAVCVVVFPMFTTFAFFPSVIKSLEQKRFMGMSKGMLFTIISINVTWIIYRFNLGINNREFTSGLITTMVWQFVSLSIYLSQVYLLILNWWQKKKINHN